MGYTRNVVLCMTADAEKKFSKLLDNSKVFTKQEIHAEMLNLIEEAEKYRDTDTKELLYHWGQVKWYNGDQFTPGRAHILALEVMIRSLPLDQFKFIVLGEDLSDTTTAGTYASETFSPEIIRKIGFDTPSRVKKIEGENHGIR